jgi:hypothetical protein
VKNMRTKLAVSISVFITVVVLSIIGGVATVVARGNPVTPTATQAVGMDPTREAQYQALLAQANQTIAQANQQIAELTAIKATPTSAPLPILSDQAVAIAGKVSGETALKTPELVNYSGKVAYAVTFTDGLVYVDANTGAVLFNGVQIVRILTKDQAAQIAVNYTGNSSAVVEVISGTYNNAPAFRVTFNNGEMVYIDLYGTVLAVQLPSSSGSGTTASPQQEVNDD